MKSWTCANCYLALEGEVATSCPGCGGTEIVPADSPRGEQIRAALAQTTASVEGHPKRRGLPPGVGLLVVLAIIVFIGGFLHVVSTTDGLRVCSKENWALRGWDSSPSLSGAGQVPARGWGEARGFTPRARGGRQPSLVNRQSPGFIPGL